MHIVTLSGTGTYTPESMWLVMCACCVCAAVFLDNPHFHLFCEALRPGFLPAAPSTARNSQLPAEYAHCRQQLQQETDLTVMADDWTDRAKRAILGLLAVFPDGRKALLRALDHSKEDDTGAFQGLLWLGYVILSCLQGCHSKQLAWPTHHV
jgi:hypothetical protein